MCDKINVGLPVLGNCSVKNLQPVILFSDGMLESHCF